MDKNELPKKIKTALLKAIRNGEFYDIPNEKQYGGDGGPGVLLEVLAGVPLRRSRGKDQPDFDEGFELKYHGTDNLITLFHKTLKPKGVTQKIVQQFGKPYDAKPEYGEGCLSLAHAANIRGFEIRDTNDNLIIYHPDQKYDVTPYFTHDTLVNTWVQKAQRLIRIHGTLQKIGDQRSVRYEEIHVYTELRNKKIVPAIMDGTAVIEFDARWRPNYPKQRFRDHGTKIRIYAEDLDAMYADHIEIKP